MSIREPKTTALIFASGKMVVTGAKSEDDSKLASRKYARIIQKLGIRQGLTGYGFVRLENSAVVDKGVTKLPDFESLRQRLNNCHNVTYTVEKEVKEGVVKDIEAKHDTHEMEGQVLDLGKTGIYMVADSMDTSRNGCGYKKEQVKARLQIRIHMSVWPECNPGYGDALKLLLHHALEKKAESDVIGIDLSPIQPKYVPPNCRFEIDDAEDEWLYSHGFDYIHARFICGGFSSFADIFRSCLNNLEPGGWAEFQDYLVKIQCVDDSLVGTALQSWNDYMFEGLRRMGKDGLAAANYKAQMLEVGFVDVTERKFTLPGNPWAESEDKKTLGVMQMENMIEGLHGFSIALFTRILGMTYENVELLLLEVRKDLRNTEIHFFYTMCVILKKVHEITLATYSPSMLMSVAT